VRGRWNPLVDEISGGRQEHSVRIVANDGAKKATKTLVFKVIKKQ
jgi:hypothetical protein